MIIFSFGGQLLGRQYSGWFGLWFAAGLMLLIQPHLIFDLGFQLSVLSTGGIMYFQPLIARVPFLTEDITTSISAQLTTTPIILFAFGTYGTLSLITNALVLWMISPIMIVGGIAGLLGLLIPIVGKNSSLGNLAYVATNRSNDQKHWFTRMGY